MIPSKKIMITGSSGMLGMDLCKCFSDGFDILGIDIRQPQERLFAAEDVDLTDRKLLQTTFDRFKPEIVFHAAAMTNVDGCEQNRDLAFQMNVVATQNVVDLANATGSHVVTFSTDYVFDGKKGNEYEEDDLPAPLNYYGETKRSAEEYVQKNCTRYTLCRISWLFGMYGTSFPRTILEKAGQVKSFEIVADQVGRPTYTKDLAEALKRVFLNEKNDRILYQQIFHLGNSGYSSWAEYAEFVLKCSNGVRPEVKSISTPANHRPAERPKFSVLALEKSKRILGVHMRPWKEAVEEFVHEYEKS